MTNLVLTPQLITKRWCFARRAQRIPARPKSAKLPTMEPALFANAFVTSRWFVTSNIIGATSIPQLKLALSSADVRWTEEMQKAVDAMHQKLGNPCP